MRMLMEKSKINSNNDWYVFLVSSAKFRNATLAWFCQEDPPPPTHTHTHIHTHDKIGDYFYRYLVLHDRVGLAQTVACPPLAR